MQYRAVAQFENNVLRDVTDSAAWSVVPTSLASVSAGLLTTQTISTDREQITLHAQLTWNGTAVDADKTVLVRGSGAAGQRSDWETYQANASHTGFAPISLEPDVFSLLWQRNIGSGASLNPVTAADERVFVSKLTYFQGGPALFALDARDGETLWTKDFGEVFSVNPPSHAYGNVYIQTGNHATDTYLHAYDAATGEMVFETPHAAQWERYYAPTIFDGMVYVDGGSYGGMYAFDAFSGQTRWFLELQQYDQWTPAVDAQYAYAYVGEYSPGLYVANRFTGAPAFSIPDPHFEWNGWSMDLAPVLGGQNDLLAIHDGRLLSFDLPTRSIRYERSRNFSGQPSVVDDRIYAIDAGALVVLDEADGTQLWSWRPPQGSVRGALIVTNTHVLATTETTTYAIELLSGMDVWSYPASGSLSLGNESLYIASANGVLTAISVPEIVPATLESLEIHGPAEATENTSVTFTAQARYSDGRVRDRTGRTAWSVEPASSATFRQPGTLEIGELLDPVQVVTVRAHYTEGTASIEATKSVRLVIGVSLHDFLARNLSAGLATKAQILDLLRESIAYEQAVVRAIGRPAAPPQPPADLSISITEEVQQAIARDREASAAVERSILNLERALMALPADVDSPEPAALQRR